MIRPFHRTIRFRRGVERSTPSSQIERWLGTAQAEKLSRDMRGWYGPPIRLLDVPGCVSVDKDGDFVGPIDGGSYYSGWDALREWWWRVGQVQTPQCAAGFASVSDALSRASQGFQQAFNGGIQKNGPTGVVGVTSSLWRVGAAPAAGAAGSAAPGGRACDSTTTGAMGLVNPAAGTMRLTGADMYASVVNNSLLLYDRIFDVAKTINSTATEAVTGVPGRFQSNTTTSENYAGGSFMFPEVGGTALAATAHNHTVIQYRNQAGTDSQSAPSIAGVSGAIVDRLDLASGWFIPLASGDTGVQDLAQLQTSALVATGAMNFVIGHPIGFMTFPIINMMWPFDWLTNRNQAPYIPNSACLALLEINKPATTATSYQGYIYATSTSS